MSTSGISSLIRLAPTPQQKTCTTCGAKPGERCVGVKGRTKDLELRTPHRARR